MVGALQGITVLDFGRYISGPFSAMLLADMGADVIKVEKKGGNSDRALRPFTKDGKSMFATTFGRNKKCITVNFRSEKGKILLKKLTGEADVIINNFRPGVMEKMGIGYADVKEINPNTIYASISGFGQEGMYKERTAFDGIAMAMTGVMSCNWGDNGPRGLGTPIADITTGYVHALAIVTALYNREKTGQGQFIDTAMVDAVMPFMETLIPTYFLTGVSDETSKRNGGDPTSAPANTFHAKNGYFYMHAGTNPHYAKLLDLIDVTAVREKLSEECFMDHQTRKNNANEIEALVDQWIGTKTVEEAERIVAGVGIPCSIINTVDRIVENDIIQSRKGIVWIDMPDVGKVPYPGNPIKLSATPVNEFRPAEEAGQSNYEVYETVLGLRRQEVEALIAEGDI